MVFEFRNGDGHYIKVKPGNFVPVTSESDVPALERAFLESLKDHLGSREAVLKALIQNEYPGRD